METQPFKSPRKVEEELRQYQRARFEAYMRMADDGTITRELGIAALRDEMESGIWTPEDADGQQ
jgi:hypothetical protein